MSNITSAVHTAMCSLKNPGLNKTQRKIELITNDVFSKYFLNELKEINAEQKKKKRKSKKI